MTAHDFVDNLLGTGRVRVGRDAQPAGGLSAAVRALDRVARPDWPGDAPPLVPAVAEWALGVVYRACQALAFRDLDAARIGADLSAPCPGGGRGAGELYSADLAFRVLPDLLGLARGAAPDDPLVGSLLELARAWPLSSVGVGGLGPVDVAVITGNPCLLRVYADQVIERADLSRLDDRRVRAAVRVALGAFPELAPAVAAAVADDDATDASCGPQSLDARPPGADLRSDRYRSSER